MIIFNIPSSRHLSLLALDTCDMLLVGLSNPHRFLILTLSLPSILYVLYVIIRIDCLLHSSKHVLVTSNRCVLILKEIQLFEDHVLRKSLSPQCMLVLTLYEVGCVEGIQNHSNSIPNLVSIEFACISQEILQQIEYFLMILGGLFCKYTRHMLDTPNRKRTFLRNVLT